MTRAHVLVLGLAAVVLVLAPPDLWPLSAAAVGLAAVDVAAEAINNTSRRYAQRKRQGVLQRHRTNEYRSAAQMRPRTHHGAHSAHDTPTGGRR